MSLSRRRLGTILALLLGLVAGGAGPVAAAEPLAEADFARANRAMSEAVVLPAHARLESASAAMADATERFCREGRGRGEVARRFDDLLEAWQRVRPIAFGPVMEGLGPARLEFWPDRRGIAARQLRRALVEEDPALLEPGALAGASVALGDLQALERLIFGEGGIGPDTYRCALAAAVARHQASLARDLNAAWRGPEGFAAEIDAALGRSDVYYEPSEATRDFVGSVSGALETALLHKLLPVMGEDAAQARPRRAENGASGRSLASIAANLETARDLLATPGGLGDLLAAAGSGPLAQGMVRMLDGIAATARSIDLPLAEAVRDLEARAALERLAERIAGLRVLTDETVPRELGLILGFNASDGD